MYERRKHIRLKDKLIVNCQIPKGNKVGKAVKCEDISSSGIRITVPKDVVKGGTADLVINFPNDAIPVLTEGKIVWVKEEREAPGKIKNKSKGKPKEENFVLGIEFSEMDELAKKRIIDYIKRKLRKK